MFAFYFLITISGIIIFLKYFVYNKNVSNIYFILKLKKNQCKIGKVVSLHTFLFHTHTKTVPRGKATFHLINPQTKKIPPLYLSVSEPVCRIPRQKPDPGTVSEKPLKFGWVAGSFMSKAPLHSFPRSAFHCSERETDSPQTHSHTHTHTQTQQPTTSWGERLYQLKEG